MSRNKPVLLLLMLALLMPHTACAAVSENLLEAQGQTQEAANYKTYTVETGVYERSYSASGSTYYPYTYNLCFETAGAKFKEYTVKRNDTVKKGDVLARILHPYEGEVIREVKAPVDGIVFFARHKSVICQHSLVFKIVKK